MSVLSMPRKEAAVSSFSHKDNLPQPFRRTVGSDESGNAPSATHSADQSKPDDLSRARIIKAYGNLPLSFEANAGQISSGARFISRARGFNLLLSPTEAMAVMSKVSIREERHHPGSNSSVKSGTQVSAIKMKFEGGNPTPDVVGLDELPGKNNYFIGNDARKWQTNVSNYAKVKYENVYPGTDVVFYGTQSQLEYDFILAPGAHPESISLSFEGAQSLRLEHNGDLILNTNGNQIRQKKPQVYQEIAGVKQAVDGQYVLRGKDKIGFAIGAYDTSRPLTIDPILSYSTYLGGSSTQYERGYNIAVDSSGNAYVTGTTMSTNFPITTGSFQVSSAGLYDTYVTKLNPTGSAPVYSTYLGGNNQEGGDTTDPFESCIAIDSAGNAYITGTTTSTNFPFTTGAYQTTAPTMPGDGLVNVFITKLNAAGNGLVYSTYLGGSGYEEASGIAVDASGNAYVTGKTLWIGEAPAHIPFPVTSGAYQSAKDKSFDVFLTKLNAAGTALSYSTLLGGSTVSGTNSSEFGCLDTSSDIAVDSSGNAYVSGTTECVDFPTTAGSYRSVKIGTGQNYDAFVTKFNSTGTALIYSTFFGGSSGDECYGMTIDATGSALITGYTESTDFPLTPGALKTTLSGTSDTFASKLNPAGSSVVFSTYLGGSGRDTGGDIAITSCGNVYVMGDTNSTDFPTTSGALKTTLGGVYDGFIVKLDATGSLLIYSTYLGGTNDDYPNGMAVDSSDHVYLTGSTSSTNYPVTTGAYRTTMTGTSDAFITKLLLGDIVGNVKPVAPDATAGTGPYTPASAEYHPGADANHFHPNATIDPTVLPDRATEIWAKYYWPQGLSGGPYPLVVFLHGNHLTCGFGSNPRVDDNVQYTTQGQCTDKHVTPFITNGTLGTPRNNFSGWVGMKVTTGAQPVTVRTLGRLVLSGNSNAHALKIVRVSDNATITPSVSVPTSGVAPGTFKYVTLPSAVTLAANTSYYVVSQETNGGDAWYDSNTTVVSTTVATVNGQVMSKNSGWTTTGAVAGHAYGPTNFEYENGTYSIAPSHRGYDYLANKLASFGYIVVSINANLGINMGARYKSIDNPGYPDFPDDPFLILARGRLVLRHLQQLSEWNINGGTPASLGVEFRGKIDFGNIGLMGHSRGGEGMRAAYNLYRDQNSPWPARILNPATFKAIFEIAPTDGKTSDRILNAEGVAWNVLLPACDGDVSQLSGVRAFDRMMGYTGGSPPTPADSPATQKSTFMVWGANHNFYNTQWQESEWGTVPTPCVGNSALFLNPTITGTGYGSAQQQQTALGSLIPFFRANVGASANPAFNQNFDPRYSLPSIVSAVTRVERGFTPSPNSSVTTVFEDFNQPTGKNSSGADNSSNGITINHVISDCIGDPSCSSALPDHYYDKNPSSQSFDFIPLPPLAQFFKVGVISWTAPGSNTYFQTNWKNPTESIDISAYQTLDFGVSRQRSATQPTQPHSLNISDATNFSIQLVMNDDSLSEPVCLSNYAELRGPVGSVDELHPIMQTVRIPLTDFAGADLSRVRGIRFIFNKTTSGAIYIGTIRLARQ